MAEKGERTRLGCLSGELFHRFVHVLFRFGVVLLQRNWDEFDTLYENEQFNP